MSASARVFGFIQAALRTPGSGIAASILAAIVLVAANKDSQAQNVVTPTCPPGYVLSGSQCIQNSPTPTCPPGYVFSGSQCVLQTPSGSGFALKAELQSELKRLGCLRGQVDGVWGPASRAALRRFSDLLVAVNGPALGTQPSDLALSEARRAGTGFCSAAGQVSPNPPPPSSGDWYAIALSSTSRSAAQAKANQLGAGWFVMNTSQCPNFRNGYWIATAGGFDRATAQAYVNQAGGDAYRKTCN